MSRPWQVLLGAALVLSVAAGFLLPHKEAKHLWEIPTFFAWYGFLGCVAIILISKALGKHLLQRPEDYYGGPEGSPDEGAEERGDVG